jgi:drug/metabolite transporter (DMT)-like permease
MHHQVGGTMSARLTLILSVISACAGQILFKKGMLLLGEQKLSSDLFNTMKSIIHIIFSPVVFAGLLLYAVSTLLWLFALSRTTLNYAYPYTALTFILVMASSWLIFSEALPSNRIIGGMVVCIGIIICAWK